MTTATTPTKRPTSPLPAAAVSAMASLDRALNPVIAEHQRVEQLVSGLRIGETAIINGTPATAISLAVSDLLERHARAAARYRRLAEGGDYEGCEYVRDEMTEYRRRLAEAGMLHLVVAEHEKTKDALPTRPRGPHPQYATAGA